MKKCHKNATKCDKNSKYHQNHLLLQFAHALPVSATYHISIHTDTPEPLNASRKKANHPRCIIHSGISLKILLTWGVSLIQYNFSLEIIHNQSPSPISSQLHPYLESCPFQALPCRPRTGTTLSALVGLFPDCTHETGVASLRALEHSVLRKTQQRRLL